MHTLKRFTYPTFIGTCSILGTLADLLQNAFIFRGVTIVLLLIGIICLISPKALFTKTKLLQCLGADASVVNGLRPFGASCLMLAAVIFGFSSLSAKSESGGGVIASAYPEIRQIQEHLGVLETRIASLQSTAESIQSDTQHVRDNVVDWVSFTIDPNYFEIRNHSGASFEAMEVKIAADNLPIISKTIPIMPHDGYSNFHPGSILTAKVVTSCLVAKSRGKTQWIIERLQFQRDGDAYTLIDQVGPRSSDAPVSCT